MSRAPMPDTVSGDAPMPSSFDTDLEFWDEGRFAKLTRRLREEPLIPVGLAATCYALWGASRSIRRGDKYTTNQFFRARVYAQSFTLVCMCVGAIYWKEDRDRRKHYQGLLGEKKAREKREAWIKELEVRDMEEQAEREGRRARREERRAAELASAALVVRDGGGDEGTGQTNSALDERHMKRLLVGSRILPLAMSRWWFGRER